MKNAPLSAVGIDVAKASLSVSLLFRNGSANALRIRNTEADIRRRLLPRLSGFSGKIILEATSWYHWLPSLVLSGAGHDVRAVNPLQSSKYTGASIRNVKNDPADAAALASMALIEPKLPASFRSTENELVLRKKIGFIKALRSQLQALCAARESFREARTAFSSIPESSAEREAAEAVEALSRACGSLEAEFETEASASADPEHIARLTSIPGVSRHTAALAIHWFSAASAKSAKSWVSYAGLDVSTKESGNWKGRTKLTKRGNPYLRQRLFSAAWGATMTDERFRRWYDRLRERGSGHREALVIIARKIVRIMYAVTKHNIPFDPALPLYAGEEIPEPEG